MVKGCQPQTGLGLHPWASPDPVPGLLVDMHMSHAHVGNPGWEATLCPQCHGNAGPLLPAKKGPLGGGAQ